MFKRLFPILITLTALWALIVPSRAGEPEITGLSEDFGQGGYSENGGEIRKYTSVNDFAHLAKTRPGTTYFLPLTAKDFEWEDGKRGIVNMRSLDELGISLHFDKRDGFELFDTIALTEVNGRAGLLIDFVDHYAAVEDEAFDIAARLLVNDYEYENSAVRIRGTLSNSTVSINTYDTKCTLGTGRYAFANDNVRNVRFSLGAGVELTADVEFSDKYYGAAFDTPDEVDPPVLEKYPQIQKVIRLDAIGLNHGKVSFTQTGGTLYVYDDTFACLGTTASSVIYRTKYYLLSEKL